MNVTKMPAKVIGSFVKTCGFPVKTSESEKGRFTVLSHDLGQDCKILTSTIANAVIKAQPQLESVAVSNTERSNSVCHKIKLADMLRKLAVASEKQGYLTASDVKEVAKVSALTPNAGSDNFKTLIATLMKKGYFTEIRGAGAANSDEVQPDVDLLDSLL